MVETLIVLSIVAGGIVLLGRRQATSSGTLSQSLPSIGMAIDAKSDLPCPWCRAATSETDTHCPSCRQPFG